VLTPSGIVTLLTDFGTEDAYVAAMKGAILTANPRANIVDVSHAVSAFAIAQAAYLLDSAWHSFPAGTVHLVVVDPGVGGIRRGLAFLSADHYYVGPDNGVFSFIGEPPSRAVELATGGHASATFHGRDVFGPAAGRVSGGTPLKELGRISSHALVRLPEIAAIKVGEAWQTLVLHCDHFGNVVTNLPPRTVKSLRAVNGTRLRPVRTYEEGEPNELLALLGSSGRVEFAVREASAANRLRVKPGETLLVT